MHLKKHLTAVNFIPFFAWLILASWVHGSDEVQSFNAVDIFQIERPVNSGSTAVKIVQPDGQVRSFDFETGKPIQWTDRQISDNNWSDELYLWG